MVNYSMGGCDRLPPKAATKNVGANFTTIDSHRAIRLGEHTTMKSDLWSCFCMCPSREVECGHMNTQMRDKQFLSVSSWCTMGCHPPINPSPNPNPNISLRWFNPYTRMIASAWSISIFLTLTLTLTLTHMPPYKRSWSYQSF